MKRHLNFKMNNVSGHKKQPSSLDQQKKTNPLENEQLLRAIASWITYNDFLATKKIMAECRSVRNGGTTSDNQSNVKLHPLLTLAMKSNNDVTWTDENGRTILHHCLWNYMPEASRYSARKMKNDAALVKTLCEMGASVIAEYRYDYSPLEVAMNANRMDLVEAMVQFNSAKVTDFNDRGNTILHALFKKSTRYGSQDCKERFWNLIDELIAKGADLNQPNKNGETPMHLTAESFDAELLKELIRRGADLHVKTSSGDDLFSLVCKYMYPYNSKKVDANLKWLLNQGFDVNTRNNNGLTVFHQVALRDNVVLAKFLVKGGADVHAVDHNGNNALRLATTHYHRGMVKYLIELGLEFDRRDIMHGSKLMFWLIRYCSNDEEALEWLTKNGLDRSKIGDLTLLHLTASNGYVRIVERLIERGADVHARDETYQYTPLHLASMRRQFGTVPELEKVGLLSGEIVDSFVYFNVRHSAQSHSSAILYADPDRYKIDYESTVTTLLKAGSEVHARDRCGRTPLHYATRHTEENDLMVLLLQAGAHVDDLDSEGLSPLHNCLLSRNNQGLVHLLSYGADINDIEHPHREICKEIKGLNSSFGSGVKRHLLKLKVAGLHVNDLYRPYLNQTEELDCVGYIEELEELKKRMLTTTVSLYDWLRVNWKRRLVFDESLPSNVEDEFPHYGIIIQNLRKQAINRSQLINPARMAFQSLTGGQWPDVCVEHVLSFLNNRTLRLLIDTRVER